MKHVYKFSDTLLIFLIAMDMFWLKYIGLFSPLYITWLHSMQYHWKMNYIQLDVLA